MSTTKDSREPQHPPSTPTTGSRMDCEHEWNEEYYGTRCLKCGMFYPFGSEPWVPDDPALAELQHMATYGDD